MQTIKMREEQLNYAFDKKSITTATEWIANSSNSSNSSGAIATSNNINLKIGNNTKLNNDQIITLDKKKEVSFNESYNDYIDNTTLDSNKIDVSNIGGVLEVLNNMDDNTSTSDKNNVNKFFNKFKTTYLDTDMNDNTYESNTNINENAAILNKVNKIYERQEELFKSIDYIKKLLNKEYEF